jgi:hypothetical protein
VQALFDDEALEGYFPRDIAYSWTSGWLDRLECGYLSVEMVRKLGRAPIARLLHDLVWQYGSHASSWLYADGPDVPAPDGRFDPVEMLAHYPAVRNVRLFQYGREVDPDNWDYSAGTAFVRLAPLIERMPKLEELYILARGQGADRGLGEMGRLFALPTLSNLRVLQSYHGYAYPLEALAANPALGRLTHLLCHPNKHARLGPDRKWSSAITPAAVWALARSPHLTSLTHLQLRCCDGGDDLVEYLVTSGALKRLKVLDLRHGRISDAGARQLAACPDAKNLEVLDLVNNRLTNAGIAALQVAGVRVRAEQQQTRPYDTGAIFWGDIE